jgi:hypothetical protein
MLGPGATASQEFTGADMEVLGQENRVEGVGAQNIEGGGRVDWVTRCKRSHDGPSDPGVIALDTKGAARPHR